MGQTLHTREMYLHDSFGLFCQKVATAAARGRSSFAAAAYAKQDQEDAAEFLQYLMDHAHLVQALLRP